MLKERHFSREFLSYTQIIDKAHLVDCVNSELPLLLVEDFHAKTPPDQPVPREVFKYVTPYKYLVMQSQAKRGAGRSSGKIMQTTDSWKFGNLVGQSLIQNKKRKTKMETLRVDQQNNSAKIG